MYVFLKNNGLTAVLIISFFLTCIYAYSVDYAAAGDGIIGGFVGVILASFTCLSSFLAFLVVCVADANKWGEVIEFKTYFAIGSLIAMFSAFTELVGRL